MDISNSLGRAVRSPSNSRGLLATALLVAAAASAGTPACKLIKLGEIPVTLRGAPRVSATIDGHPAEFIVDTGAAISLIWKSTVTDLKLPGAKTSVGSLCGAGGCREASRVRVQDFGLADFLAHDVSFVTTASVPDGDAAGGILGEDFLSKMDVEFDLGAGRIRLFQPVGCPGDQVVYWAPAYFMVTLLPSHETWLETHAALNGHDAVAMFDTGSTVSTVTTDLANRPGMAAQASTDAAQTMHGLGPKTVALTAARFASLTLGQEVIQNPTLRVADLFGADRQVKTGSYIRQSTFQEPDLIIGADFFMAHRVYVARSQKKIYFTYSGGRIFEPVPTREPTSVAPAAPGPAPDGAAPEAAKEPGR
jgi:predicted aspartyl protease